MLRNITYPALNYLSIMAIVIKPTYAIASCNGFIYDPDTKDGFSGQNYFPDEMPRANYYKPVEAGFEREIIKRLDYWEKLRNKKAE